MAEVTSSVVNTPHPADILDGAQPHVRHVLAVTEQHGLQVKDLVVDPTDITERPFRAKGERTVTDLDSLLAEIERRPLHEFDSTIWGTATRDKLTIIYNDHGLIDGHAGWRDDKLTLQLAQDEDWAAWHEISGTYFKQGPFGDKIEELLHTVTSPDQADLLEIIDSIRASTSGEFESAIERANGSQKLTYKQEHTVKAGRGGQLEIPQIITLDLRPWEGHPETYEVQAYFRTRVQDGALGLAVKLKPTRQIIREAWYAVTRSVSSQTGKPVMAVG